MNTELRKKLVIDPVVDVEESYQAIEIVRKSGVNKSIYKYTQHIKICMKFDQ